jgi:Tol biopolymer transport system component
MDLTTMESKPLISKYIGTPDYSEKANLIAFAYPSDPGEFEVHTMRLDGSDIKTYKSPRLSGRWLSWDVEGKGVYYLGQEITEAKEAPAADKDPEKDKSAHGQHRESARAGVTALWRLDFATGEEKRISPADIHLNGFSESPDGGIIVLSGVLEKSRATEIFTLDRATGEMKQPFVSRVSSWMPVPSPDATKLVFFTNDKGLETLKIAGYRGDELASYPGFALERDVRLYWLPESEGLLVFSGRGVFAFTEKGPIMFPGSKDLRAYLYADVSLQADEVLLSAVPQYGETPGLYMLHAADNKFTMTDLRSPPYPEIPADRYLQPRWSFDGSRIAFTDGLDVWTMKADGTSRRRITRYAESNEGGKEKPSLASYPVWSVKGEMLCYTLTVYDGKNVLRQLWVVKADGSTPKMLFSEEVDSQFQVFLPEYTNQPFFDVDDERIIFTAAGQGVPNIVSVDVKDGTMRRLTDKGAIYPALLPEEGVVVYTSLEGNTEEIWMMNSDGTGKHRFDIKPAPFPGKNEIPSSPTESTPAPVKEIDKPAAQTKETEAIKKEEPAKKKAPLKKKKPAKKAVAPETEPVKSLTTRS